MTNENSCNNEVDISNSLHAPSLDHLSNTVISNSSTEQQLSVTPYRLQLEGRRRLNTLERIRARHQNQESTELHQPPPPPAQLQLQNEYTLKPEDYQDPIIRRALERFDEKSRSLMQAKAPTYDDIQDPITRRAVMRLESNLKRTMPSNPPVNNTELENTWFTNNYTLGTLQSNNDPRFARYPESPASLTSNSKPTHVSAHQRFASTSSTDMSEAASANHDPDIPILRVPTQPVYVTSNPPQPPISFRQRSRSEDMLASRELSLSQENNLDEQQTDDDLQRNHSSDELHQEVFAPNEMNMSLPNTMSQPLDSNFVRSAEKSVNYNTPAQSYSAYSCEYTRPYQDQSLNSSQSEHFSPRNIQQQPQHPNEIQLSSAFQSVHPPTNNFYPPPPAYQSTYAPNNPHQTPYSDDPM